LVCSPIEWFKKGDSGDFDPQLALGIRKSPVRASNLAKIADFKHKKWLQPNTDGRKPLFI
jgi:hypothetical protein